MRIAWLETDGLPANWHIIFLDLRGTRRRTPARAGKRGVCGEFVGRCERCWRMFGVCRVGEDGNGGCGLWRGRWVGSLTWNPSLYGTRQRPLAPSSRTPPHPGYGPRRPTPGGRGVRVRVRPCCAGGAHGRAGFRVRAYRLRRWCAGSRGYLRRRDSCPGF